ncbi:thioredoxin domain-containing protein 2-like [Hypanus sabinus]|uniref:thioredoxin domain-containing protein 2-like n=1 Tax=Hypanus sabinus TaxID=79690 RepID=UPI0028C4A6B2|nr:thioredoxin domain-containing protein 2-like [Hypanus sabinus]
MAGAGGRLGKPKKAQGKSTPAASSQKAAVAAQAKALRSPAESGPSRIKAGQSPGEAGSLRGKVGQPPPPQKAQPPTKVEGANKAELPQAKAKQQKAEGKKEPEAESKSAEGLPLKTISSKTQLTKSIKEAGERLVVIFFSGSWCETCQGLKPAMRELAQLNNVVLFYEVNVDDSEDTAEACDIVHIPTFQFYKQGKKVAEVLDDSVDTIEEKIKELK